MQHLYRSSLECSWKSSSRGKGLTKTLNFFAGARGISSHNIGLKVKSNLCSDFIVYKKLSWVRATLKHLNLKLNGCNIKYIDTGQIFWIILPLIDYTTPSCQCYYTLGVALGVAGKRTINIIMVHFLS